MLKTLKGEEDLDERLQIKLNLSSRKNGKTTLTFPFHGFQLKSPPFFLFPLFYVLDPHLPGFFFLATRKTRQEGACGREVMEPGSASGEGQIKGVLTHGGRYVQYNVYGNLFEVSTKYVPPLRPVGRGAYGIVW